ncbi:hypothetical protein LCGC14_1035720 [marine sediment metagenome]|uniref:Uncharacterized protein n=1 Tax=marine sediment metagenome TaxID=412755 RepID=A0A0F9NEX1_9ZZZZ
MSDEKDKLKIAAQRAARVVVAQKDLSAEVPLAAAKPPEELDEDEQEAEDEGTPLPNTTRQA